MSVRPHGSSRHGRSRSRFLSVVLAATIAFAGARHATAASPLWGRLANPGRDGLRIKTALFFAGQARDGTNPYACTATPAPNLALFTVKPADNRHLAWSSNPLNRGFALEEMARACINVVTMSSWGEDFLPCLESWAPWAPMQTAPGSHDELFAAAADASLLVMPFIESRGNWNLRNEFPRWTDGRVAPGTVNQIINLIERYLKNAAHPEWASRWARVYDSAGKPRHAVVLIHASSNRLTATDHAAFAQGFDLVAGEVLKATGVAVGFFIDALPPDSNAPGILRPSPGETGPFLRATASILGLQCFIPEIWMAGSPGEIERYRWKWVFSERWIGTGIPFLMDVCPGYDAHIVFPTSVVYGFTDTWLKELALMAAELGGDGIAYNSWNGYTEAMTGMPLLVGDGGDRYFRWLRSLACTRFRRGDANSDGAVDISDAVCILGFLFGPRDDPCKSGLPRCLARGDASDDGQVDIADAVRVLGHLFANGGPLPQPFGACAIDPTPDDLGCLSYAPCGE